MESLSCGVPVVAFAIGGLLHIVGYEGEREGYLARPFDSEELARGIEWVLDNQKRLYSLSETPAKKQWMNSTYSALVPSMLSYTRKLQNSINTNKQFARLRNHKCKNTIYHSFKHSIHMGTIKS